MSNQLESKILWPDWNYSISYKKSAIIRLQSNNSISSIQSIYQLWKGTKVSCSIIIYQDHTILYGLKAFHPMMKKLSPPRIY